MLIRFALVVGASSSVCLAGAVRWNTLLEAGQPLPGSADAAHRFGYPTLNGNDVAFTAAGNTVSGVYRWNGSGLTEVGRTSSFPPPFTLNFETHVRPSGAATPQDGAVVGVSSTRLGIVAVDPGSTEGPRIYNSDSTAGVISDNGTIDTGGYSWPSVDGDTLYYAQRSLISGQPPRFSISGVSSVSGSPRLPGLTQDFTANGAIDNVITHNGNVVFTATTDRTFGSTRDAGLFRANPSTGVQALITAGDPLPGGGTYTYVDGGRFLHRVAFDGVNTLLATGIGNTTTALYLHDGSAWSRVFEQNDINPNTGAIYGPLSGETWFGVGGAGGGDCRVMFVAGGTLWLFEPDGLHAVDLTNAAGQTLGADTVIEPRGFDGQFLAFASGVTTPGAGTVYGMQLLDLRDATKLDGDANDDGRVDVSDLGILAANFRGNLPGGFADGDFNLDGMVNVSDLGILAANFRAVAAGPSFAELSAAFGLPAVPEPAVLMPMAGGVLAVGRRRR